MSKDNGGHTKGPWCVMQYGYEKYSVNGEYGVEICGAWRRQDAHLIAAAPDLLEALDALFADYKALADSGDAGFWKLEECDVGKQAMAAIAKARGDK